MKQLLLVVACLALVVSACKKLPEKTHANTAVVGFTLAYVCSDGQELYRDDAGDLEQWNVSDKGYFVKLDKSLTAEMYCQGHQKKEEGQ